LLTSVTTTTYSNGTSSSTTAVINYTNSSTGKETGLPNSIGGNTLTWTWGNQLALLDNSDETVTYTYNDAGIRTSKSVYNKTTHVTTNSSYVLEGDKVVYETVGANKLHYSYSSAGDLLSVNLNGTEYYYIFNAQGDVVGLINTSGIQVVSYSYDAYGNAITTTGSESGDNQLGGLNPYRYRGYRYDSNTKWYYLQSRYYIPELSRFLSSDDNFGLVGGIISSNLFAYCSNNPVSAFDPNGDIANWIIGGSVGLIVGGIVGGVISYRKSGKVDWR
jgi:RHS repeat-associated protein